MSDAQLETVFSVAGMTAGVGWLGLIFLYRWRPVRLALTWGAIPLLISVLYATLVLTSGKTDGGFSSLAAVWELFQNKQVLLAGWVHYLAFDLLIGSFETYDAERNGIPHILVVPILLVTFLLGPVGYASYMLVRTFYTRKPFLGFPPPDEPTRKGAIQ